MSWDGELEDFKSKIDLREYAAAQGYTLDRRDPFPFPTGLSKFERREEWNLLLN